MARIKETYLLILIVVGLLSLSLYSTYALFTASTEISNVVSFEASLTTNSNVLEYEMITVPASETKTVEVTVNNNYGSSLYYGTWYEVVSPASNADVDVYLTEDGNTSGVLQPGSSVDLSVAIENNGTTDAVVNVGTVASITPNLGLDDTKQLIEPPEPMGPALTTLASLGLDDDVNETVLTEFTTSSNNDGTLGIYISEDDLGTSYYFRGNVVNNYVKFAKNSSGQDMYWRIIRINGDGSVRMIYDGTSAHANDDASEDRQVGKSNYNTKIYDNAEIGYMNGTTDGTNFPNGGTKSISYDEAHDNITNSIIKSYVEDWYEANIVNTGYSGSVADAIYCNDRSINSGTGFNTTRTYYEVYNRIYNTKTPTLKCTREKDKFTKNTTLGNGKLEYPVGLITADELMFGGNTDAINPATYLSNGNYIYYTISPHYFGGSGGTVFIENIGRIQGDSIYGSYSDSGGVRPVISLSPTAITGGTGGPTDPFTVS